MPGDWIKEAEAVNDNHWLNDAEEVSQEPTLLQKYGEAVLRPTLQGLGAVGGGLVGTAAGPVGTIGGAGAGYAAGDQLYKVIQDYAGNRAPETLSKRLTDTTKDLMTGATMEMGGQALNKAVTGAIKAIPKVATKASKALYDIPEKAAKHIANNPEQVKAAMGETNYSGGQKLLQTIEQAKNNKVAQLNAGLEEAISKAETQGKTIDIERTLDILKQAKNKLGISATPTRQAEHTALDRQINLLEEYKAAKGSNISVRDANELKRQLQAEGFTTDPNTGIKYYKNDKVGDAVRKAASNLKNNIQKEVPEVKPYNEGLRNVLEFETDKKFQQAFNKQNIENTMKNLQSDTNNKGYLKELVDKADKELGTNIKDTTDDFFAAKFLRDPDSGSAYKTGRSQWPMTLGAVIGGGIGGSTGGFAGGAAGTAIGGTLGTTIGSPQLFKAVAPRAAAIQRLIEQIGLEKDAQSLYRAFPYAIGRRKD